MQQSIKCYLLSKIELALIFLHIHQVERNEKTSLRERNRRTLSLLFSYDVKRPLRVDTLYSMRSNGIRWKQLEERKEASGLRYIPTSCSCSCCCCHSSFSDNSIIQIKSILLISSVHRTISPTYAFVLLLCEIIYK